MTVTSSELLTIQREIRIAAPPETVFPFLTDATRMVQWMGRIATLDPRPGGVFRLDYNGFDVMRGEFLEVTPPKRVVFSWGWESEGAAVGPGASRVEVTLTADGEGTIVRLVHSGLPADGDTHGEGWDHFLPRLAALAGGGEAVPDEWAPRKAELLAAELKTRLTELAGLVDVCPPDRWNVARTGEGWTLAATATHALSHAGMSSLALAVGTGNAPEMNITLEMVDAKNAADASASAGRSKTEIRDQIAEASATLVQPLREMPDDHLQRTTILPALGTDPVTAEMLIRVIGLDGLAGHIASIRAAIGEQLVA